MRRASLIILASILFLACQALFPANSEKTDDGASAKNVQAIPFAEVKALDFIFNPVPDGTQIVHDFIVKNKGNADLIIHKVNSG